MPQAMGADLSLGASVVDRSVGVYHVMVAYLGESSGAVPAVYVGNGDLASGRCGRAVDDDAVDLSHSSVVVICTAKLHSRQVAYGAIMSHGCKKISDPHG